MMPCPAMGNEMDVYVSMDDESEVIALGGMSIESLASITAERSMGIMGAPVMLTPRSSTGSAVSDRRLPTDDRHHLPQ